MSEYQRTVDGAGTIYQWVDSEICMVIDMVTGEPQRVLGNATCTFEQALQHTKNMLGWEGSLAIVKLPCIRAFKVQSHE